MEWNQKIQKIKSRLNTQPIAFASSVHGGMLSREEGANNGADMNGKGIVPMETKEGVPPRAP